MTIAIIAPLLRFVKFSTRILQNAGKLVAGAGVVATPLA